jgi:hypothetical protein
MLHVGDVWAEVERADCWGSHLPDPTIRMGSSFERFATPLVSVRSAMFAFGRAGRAVRGDMDFLCARPGW